MDTRIRIRIQIKIKMKRIHNIALYDMFIKIFIYYTICILGNYANSSLLLSFKVSNTMIKILKILHANKLFSDLHAFLDLEYSARFV